MRCGLWAVGCGLLWAVGCGLWAAVGCGLWAAVGCGLLWAVGCEVWVDKNVKIIVYAGHNEPTATAVSIEMSGVLLIVRIVLKVEHFTPLTLCTRLMNV